MSRAGFFLLFLGACADKEAEPAPVEGGALTLETPAAASWLAAGTVEARGTATNVDEVVVNGSIARLRHGEFTADVDLVRGAQVVEASVVDGRGDTFFARHGVLVGDFTSPEGDVEEALQLRLNQGGLDAAMALAAGMVDAATLDASLSAINPVYSDSYGVWGWDAVTIAADVETVSFSTPVLVADPETGELTLTATIPDLYVAVRAYGEVVGIDFDTDVTLEASAAVVTGTLAVDVQDGMPVVTLEDATVTFQDFSYDTSLLPGDVEAYILVDTIRTTLETKIVEAIEEMVPPVLEETLAGLDPSFALELLGTTVDLAFSFADFGVDDDGLYATLDLDVEIPPADARSYAGYLSAGDGEPELDTAPDLSAAVSDDLLNRLLFEAWRGGLVDLRLSTDDGSIDGAFLAPFHADEGTITVSPQLPPVVVEVDGGLQAQIAELLVTIDTPGGDLGEHMAVAVALTADLDVGVEDGELVLGIGTPVIVLAVRESDWGATDETITRLLEENLPIDTLLALLGDIRIALPSLYGITVDTGAATRDADQVHTDVEIWLE